MSISQRVAADVMRLETIPLPSDISAEIIVTCRELKKCGWSDEQIQTLHELIVTERTSWPSSSLH